MKERITGVRESKRMDSFSIKIHNKSFDRIFAASLYKQSLMRMKVLFPNLTHDNCQY